MLAVEFADLVCRVLPLKIELSDLAIGDSFQTKNPNQDQMALWNTGFSAKGLSAEEFAHPDEFALGRCRSVQALQVPVGEEHEESNGAGDERLRSLFNWGIPLLLHVLGITSGRSMPSLRLAMKCSRDSPRTSSTADCTRSSSFS